MTSSDEHLKKQQFNIEETFAKIEEVEAALVEECGELMKQAGGIADWVADQISGIRID